ncbi:unnamed protein product [Adineta steineri]|uniref:Uncharacterized protein n=2 Tax=Adineta steineri TaxID=433720 RepID=A0A819Y4U5_9BILA|nr:unnamed protein product [Adineta steineri]
MFHKKSNKQQYILFRLAFIPLVLSFGSFLLLNYGFFSYIEERQNEKNYLNTTCFLNGTLTYREPCHDRSCSYTRSPALCPSTFQLCLKTVYIIIYENNQQAFTYNRPSWANDDKSHTICYYDKTKSGIVRWKKPTTKQFKIQISFGILLFTASIILWIVWAHLKNNAQLTTISNNHYRILRSEL